MARTTARDRGLLLGAAGCAVVFGMLLVLVVTGWAPLLSVDHAVVAAADALLAGRPLLVTAVLVITDGGSPFAVDVVTGLAVAGLAVARRGRDAVFVLVVRLLELGVETLVKNVVDRPRPVPVVVLDVASGSAFPSGHTAGTAAFWTSVLVLALPALSGARRVAAFAAVVVVVVAVAASRVLLAVHYPSDVAGGALLGVACASGAAVLLRRVPTRGERPRPTR